MKEVAELLKELRELRQEVSEVKGMLAEKNNKVVTRKQLAKILFNDTSNKSMQRIYRLIKLNGLPWSPVTKLIDLDEFEKWHKENINLLISQGHD